MWGRCSGSDGKFGGVFGCNPGITDSTDAVQGYTPWLARCEDLGRIFEVGAGWLGEDHTYMQAKQQ